MRKISVFIILLLLPLAGCGGGDGSSQSPSNSTFKISLSGTLPTNSAIGGAEFTLTLPANVTPAMVNGALAGTVVTPSGTFSGGSLFALVYTQATAGSPATLKVVLANANPAGVTQAGEIATVTLQLANGAEPSAATFSVTSVDVRDVAGNPIGAMQAVVSGLLLQ